MKYLVLVIAISLSACAAKGPLYKEVQRSSLDGQSRIVIFRKDQFVDGGSCYTVRVDDTPVGVLGNGGFLEVMVEPGEHNVSIPHLKGKTLTVPANLESNTTYYVEYNSTLNGVSGIPIGNIAVVNTDMGFALTPVPETYALAELETLRDSSEKVSCMATLK